MIINIRIKISLSLGDVICRLGLSVLGREDWWEFGMGFKVMWEGFIYPTINKMEGVISEWGGLEVCGHIRHA